MKLITIKPNIISAYENIDPEILLKEHRPAVLVIQLKYKGAVYDFAVPFRSNIPPATPKNSYFALPPRSTTKPKHHHGLHYIKMFPVAKSFFEKYHIEGNVASTMYVAIIDKNENEIVDGCQTYLNNYANGICPMYSTNIDKLIECMESMISR